MIGMGTNRTPSNSIWLNQNNPLKFSPLTFVVSGTQIVSGRQETGKRETVRQTDRETQMDCTTKLKYLMYSTEYVKQ